MEDGIFIVIEGVDRAAEQVALLQKALASHGTPQEVITFPRKQEPASYFAREYAHAAYGEPSTINPYTAALFFALDRYEAASQIRKALGQGKVVIVTGYSGATMAEQGAKCPHPEERRGYFIWLDNLEYQMLQLPRPTHTFVLNAADADSHSAEVYNDLCQLFPKDFERIDTVRNNQSLSPGTLHKIIWEKVEPLLPERSVPSSEPPAPTQSKRQVVTLRELPELLPKETKYLDYYAKTKKGQYPYFVPKLKKDIRELYIQKMDRIFDLYAQMYAKLEHKVILRQVLPLAALCNISEPSVQVQASGHTPIAKKIVESNLQENYSAEVPPITLAHYWPKNELELTADLLYEHSSLPLKEIKQQVESWPYEQRQAVFGIYKSGSLPARALEKVRYSWDLVTDFATFTALQQPQRLVQRQLLTPRYGYEVPAEIEAAGLSELFEECFDISLELHSQMHAAGYLYEAEYAVLMGHKLRWNLTVSVQQLRDLAQQEATHLVLKQLREKVSEVHPLIADVIF